MFFFSFLFKAHIWRKFSKVYYECPNFSYYKFLWYFMKIATVIFKLKLIIIVHVKLYTFIHTYTNLQNGKKKKKKLKHNFTIMIDIIFSKHDFSNIFHSHTHSNYIHVLKKKMGVWNLILLLPNIFFLWACACGIF